MMLSPLQMTSGQGNFVLYYIKRVFTLYSASRISPRGCATAKKLKAVEIVPWCIVLIAWKDLVCDTAPFGNCPPSQAFLLERPHGKAHFAVGATCHLKAVSPHQNLSPNQTLQPIARWKACPGRYLSLFLAWHVCSPVSCHAMQYNTLQYKVLQ